MNKSTKFIGIDISKKVFDVWSEEFGHKLFKNNTEGFGKFILLLDSDSWCVMEFTGSYYQNLALFLYENSISVSIINPLVIKRFIQMKLQIANTNGFKTFDNAKQVSAFFGLSPVETSSGTSVRGKSRISKRGNPLMRNYLFMCSFTACKNNPQCKALYDRIVAKGKSKKLALIAVINKLIKQAFAVAKSGMPYDPNYKSVLAQQ